MNPAGTRQQKRKAKQSPGKKSAIVESRKLINKAKKIRKMKQHPKYLTDESDEGDERTRTPSGMELEGKVQGIRSFFSPVQQGCDQSHMNVSQGVINRENASVAEQQQLDHDQVRDRAKLNSLNMVNEASADKNNNNNKQARASNAQCMKDEDQMLRIIADQMNSKGDGSSEEEHSHGLEDEEDKNEISDSTSIKRIRMVSNRELNNEENPKTMAITAVVETLRLFKQDITTEIRAENSKLRAEIQEDLKTWKSESVRDAKQLIHQEIPKNEEFKTVQAELAFWKIKAETLAEICDRMNTEMTDLTTRIDNIELNSGRKKLIMTGIVLADEKDKEASIAALDDFLSKAMNISVHVDDYFIIGEDLGTGRSIVLIFSSLEDKRKVLSAKANLKDVRVNGNKVFINEYLPPVALEKRKRDQAITNSFRDIGEEGKLSYKRGVLSVAGKPYRKIVSPPTPRELVNLSPEQISKILGTTTNRGDEFIKQNSSFIGYSADVSSHHEIKEVYKKIKLIKPEARHVVCAYIIQHDQEMYGKDYSDDGEPGAGRVLLNMMERNNITQKAIFIARKYGGERMGSSRFVCYVKAGKSCLGLDPDVEDPAPKRTGPAQGRSTGSRSNMWRGRGGGRGHSTSTKTSNIQSHTIDFNRDQTRGRGNPWHKPKMTSPPIRQPGYDQTSQTASFYSQLPLIQQQIQKAMLPWDVKSRYEREMGYSTPHRPHQPGGSFRGGYPNRSQQSSRHQRLPPPSIPFTFAAPKGVHTTNEDGEEGDDEQWASDNMGEWATEDDTDPKHVYK